MIVPRYKEYRREDVLDASTQVFWEKGYRATSMNDLVEATGLNKHSMYKEFGNKDGLFLACLEHYANETTKDLFSILTEQPLGFHNIESFFRNRIDSASSSKFKSCLLINTAIEKEVLSDEINYRTQEYISLQEEAFYNCLEAARRNGEIPENKDIEVLAKYLMCFLEGINVMGKTGPTKKSLELLVNEVLATVTS
jgi:TetR/AcrR family transcriptional repressor of nem operon